MYNWEKHHNPIYTVLFRRKGGGGFWREVQRAVRAGQAPIKYPIGSQLAVDKNSESILFDVVAHDYNVAPHDRYKHSMTLLTHKCVVNSLQYDAIEALFYCEDELPAGIYHFTVTNQNWFTEDNGKNFQFELTQLVPAGGQLVLNAIYNQKLAGKSIKAYSSSATTAVLETATLSEGSRGTSLGKTDGNTNNMNHLHRALLGSNNWEESAIRQFLNSDAAAGAVWKPQTKFDRPPSWNSSKTGWMSGLDPEFLSVVGTTKVTNRTNNIYEVDIDTVKSCYVTEDKFWLPSRSEIFGGSESGLSDGKLLPYYEGATNADRIKYNSNEAARYWRLRSPYPSTTDNVRTVSIDGSLYSNSACISGGVAAACTIF